MRNVELIRAYIANRALSGLRHTIATFGPESPERVSYLTRTYLVERWIPKLRMFLSYLDGNQPEMERLRDPRDIQSLVEAMLLHIEAKGGANGYLAALADEVRQASIIEVVMAGLGYETEVKTSSVRDGIKRGGDSKARRMLAKARA